MRIWIWIGMLMATTVGASAQIIDGPAAVPEIDAFAGLAAMGVVGSIAGLIWERRRKKYLAPLSLGSLFSYCKVFGRSPTEAVYAEARAGQSSRGHSVTAA